jgi:dihydrofolate reductase
VTTASIALIAAIARNGVIGRDNALVWREPQDQQHFRALTLGCPVVMGRRTWESLPARFRPLPDRRNIVVSRQPAFVAEGAEVTPDLAQALALVSHSNRVFVIGGAQLYAQALPQADTLLLTEVDADLDGDVFFPAWDRTAFEEVSRRGETGAGGLRFDFVEYRRRAAPPPPPADQLLSR